jgi:hypothetical protein
MKHLTSLGTTGADRKQLLLPELVRSTHMHVIGAPGQGKSKFLEHLIREDILNGEGLCLIDPHGELYTNILRWCAEHGFLDSRRIVLFDPTESDWVFGFNPLAFGIKDGEDLSYAVDAMARAAEQVWGGEDTLRTPLLRRVLKNVFHALAENRLTLYEALHLIDEHDPDGVRLRLTSRLKDPVVAAQWRSFNAMPPREFREVFSSTANRLLEFLSADIVRGTIGQLQNVVDMARLMDEGAIVLVNLSGSGRLPEGQARVLGALLVNDLFLKARRRPPKSRPFYLYLDEAQRFVNEDVSRILDEGRKFGLHLILAHQHLSQLREEAGERVYGSVMTSARSKVVFGGLATDDARILTEQLYMGHLDLHEAKSYRPAVTGYIRTWLHSHSETKGQSWSENSSSSESSSETVYDEDDDPSVTTGASSSDSSSSGGSSSETEGVAESFEPVIEWLPEPYSIEEQVYRTMALMVNQPRQRAIVKLPDRPPRRVKTPTIRDGLANDSRIEQLKLKAFQRTSFALPRQEALKQIEDRQLKLLQAGDAPGAPSDPDDFLVG